MVENRQLHRRELVALCRQLARRGTLEPGVPREGRLVVAAFTSRRALLLDLPVFAELPADDLVVLVSPDAPLTPPAGVHVVSVGADEALATRWEMGVAGPAGARHLVATAPPGEAPPYAHDPPDRQLSVRLSTAEEASHALSALLDELHGDLPPEVAAAARRRVA